ncbi:MAG: SRPBCC family protein [Proteobacteria bacterium]|nr:SRPBCC family protein [Pseudomonadota bacterium]MDA1057829.1 SRPBCC family protein [Pseudomonadota bacterium]
MGTIIVTKNIAASADRAWAALADFGNIANFHPGLSGSHLLDGSAANGVGAERRCDIKDGNYLVERVRDWHEGQSYTIDIIESSMPVRRATATLSVKPIDAHHSQAAMVVDMTMKFGLLGKVMEILMARSAMRRTMVGILDGLDTFAGAAAAAPAGAGTPIAASA